MARISRYSRRSGVAAINITPLVDVLLILLVLVLLAMPMYVKRLPIDLPRTELGGTPTPQNALSVFLLPGEKVQLGGSDIELNALQARVSASTTVELAIDKSVPYEDIAKVVQAVQARNPKEIVLLTR